MKKPRPPAAQPPCAYAHPGAAGIETAGPVSGLRDADSPGLALDSQVNCQLLRVARFRVALLWSARHTGDARMMFFIEGEWWRAELEQARREIMEAEPVAALERLTALLAELQPESGFSGDT